MKQRPGGGGSGMFSRQGQLFRGGPAEGYLQTLHPAGRLIALVSIVTGLSFCHNSVVLTGVFTGLMTLALLSFLSVVSIFRFLLIPLILFVTPTWAVAVLMMGLPVELAILAILRTACCILTGSVFLHSIGLLHVTKALRWFRLPEELCLAWHMMIVQASNFSQLSDQMVLAGEARQLKPRRGGLVRRQLGGQMGLLLARMHQRGTEMAKAMEARRISIPKLAPAQASFALRDFVFTIAVAAAALTVGSA